MGDVIRRLVSLVVGMAAVFAFSGSPQADPAIGDFANFQQVSAQRVSRVITEFTYRALATNGTPAVENVTATVTSSSPNTIIVDGDLDFGAIAENGNAQSSDTFSFRHDRRFPFDPTALLYSFQFDPVAGNTPPTANAGPDQSVFLGATVTLDGSGSSDLDGDPLTFSWSLTSVPAGSGASLSSSSAVNPTFVAGLPGTYIAELTVNDGTDNSAPDTVTITTVNSPPVADSGPDQTVFVTDTVTLDGSGSSDVDGDPLTFSWSFISVPSGSAAALSNPAVVAPTFVADAPGSYELELIVNDGTVDSLPDTVTITTTNSPPVADAGSDQTVFVTELVALDGSGSSDVDGDPLIYFWSFTSLPAGSAASLSNPDPARPTFVADMPGTYVAQLTVNDGTVDSAPDTVTITTSNSAPVADAGPDQTVFVTDTVTLDGSGSSDVDGDPLTYFWSFTSLPPGSAALLSNPDSVSPTFDVDLPGTYVVQLIVDDGLVDSAPDTVTITTLNSPPVADAGPDQTVLVTESVTLDGSGSSDVDGDPLTFSWSLTSVPAGSTAQLSGTAAVMPTFNVDLPGSYIAQLIVNDDTVDSAPDTVLIDTANSPPVADAGPDQTVFVTDTVTLDGSGSTDVDGDLLSFSWSLVATPAGSLATFSDTTAVMPTFEVDLPGVYVAQLIVNDGTVDSPPDTVTIDTTNSPPVADAGPDQTVFVTDVVTLDGSGSSDVDFDLLSYRWSFTAVPAGSAAALSNPSAIMPTFQVDQPGTYVIQLIVNDGTVDSAPDTVMITTTNSPPVADAGPDQTVFVTDTVLLDGSGSSDVDGDPLTYSWSLTAVPTGSTAAINNPTSVTPDFVADLPGTYVAQLIVNDGTVDSTPNTVLITTQNSPPVANAGPNQNVAFGTPVTLDGSASSDIDGDPLTFQWTLTSLPAGSTASLTGADTANPSFDPDLAGAYIAELVVNDGLLDSSPDTVTVTVDPAPTITPFSGTIGAGLQFSSSAAIAVPNHGGVTVRIESNDPSIALIAPDETTPGTAFIDVVVPDGSTVVPYVVQGVVGALGPATVTASAPGFSDGIGTIDIVQPALTLFGLAGGQSVGTNDVFSVLLGLPNAAGTGLSSTQRTSAAAAPLVLTLTSSNGAVGEVSIEGNTGATVNFDIPANEFQPFATFIPLSAGATTVSASIPGFQDSGASLVITVDPPGIQPFSRTIGAGLQFPSGANLDIANHGGMTVRLESSNPAVALVAPDANTPGSPFIDVVVPNNSAFVPYAVQGVANAQGTVTITASAPGFTDGFGSISIVQPAVTAFALSGSQSVGTNDAFSVLLGLPNAAGTGLSSLQGVSAAAAPLILTLSSSNGAVGEISAGGSTGGTVMLDVAAGEFQPFATFVPLAAGATTVSASIPGFLATTAATVDITVDPPGFSIFARDTAAGLQFSTTASLDISNHGGITVRIESSDPSIALIAPDGLTPGSAFIDVAVADGSATVLYTVQGVAGARGTVSITFSAPGFTNGVTTTNVVQPAAAIFGLASSLSVGQNDTFTIFLGIPNGAGTGVGVFRGVSAAAAPLVLTLSSSDPAVGEMMAGGTSAGTITLNVPANEFQPSATFVPLATGTSTATVGASDFLSLGTVAVTVGP